MRKNFLSRTKFRNGSDRQCQIRVTRRSAKILAGHALNDKVKNVKQKRISKRVGAKVSEKRITRQSSQAEIESKLSRERIQIPIQQRQINSQSISNPRKSRHVKTKTPENTSDSNRTSQRRCQRNPLGQSAPNNQNRVERRRNEITDRLSLDRAQIGHDNDARHSVNLDPVQPVQHLNGQEIQNNSPVRSGTNLRTNIILVQENNQNPRRSQRRGRRQYIEISSESQQQEMVAQPNPSQPSVSPQNPSSSFNLFNLFLARPSTMQIVSRPNPIRQSVDEIPIPMPQRDNINRLQRIRERYPRGSRFAPIQVDDEQVGYDSDPIGWIFGIQSTNGYFGVGQAYNQDNFGWFFEKNKIIKICQITQEILEKETICPICLQDFIQKEHQAEKGQNTDLIELFCKHIFHKRCAQKCLKEHRARCPVCRTDFRDHKTYEQFDPHYRTRFQESNRI